MLSYSSYRTYFECPLRWKFLYVDRLPEAPRGYFSFGRTVHSVLEDLLRPLVVPTARLTPAGDAQRTLDDFGGRFSARGRLMSREELLAAYAAHWVSDGYVSAEEESRYRLLGETLLTAYLDDVARAPPTPVALEEHLEAKWEGMAVHGYIDRIDRAPDGGLEILDYKTSRALSDEDVRTSDQLTLYQVLVEKNYAEPVRSLTLYHLRSLRPLTAPRRAEEAVDGLRERFGRASDGIRADSFEPTPGRACSRCEFKSHCPEFKAPPDGERAGLLALVDRFASLRAEEDRLDGELRRAAEELHRAAERLGVHRLSGSARVAIRRREEEWRFRAAAVRELLSANGLADRADPDDPEAVARLLKDPSLPATLRRRLAEAGGRRVRWFWVLEDADGPG